MEFRIVWIDRLTSAHMKANVLIPPKNPTNTETSSINPDSAKIEANNAINLK